MSGTPEEVLALLREWESALEEPEPLLIETSGSTGRPKRVVLSRRALRASADATHARLGGPGEWVLTLPPSYVAGVQVLFRSVRAGLSPVLLGDRALDALPAPLGRRYLSLVPTQLVRLLRDDATWEVRQALTEYAGLLIGGGPLDPGVRAEAEAQGLRIVQTYGMSETGGGCVYDGRPLDGVELRIAGSAGSADGSEDGVGEVQLRGPMLFDGYAEDAERTAQVLTDDGWLRTDDLGRLAADGRLELVGRVDDMVISGGVKVPASVVAAMVARDDAALDVLVVGCPDDEWGERVVAVVEARDPITLAGVRGCVTPRAWAPRQLVVVGELPRLANGKPDRLAARRLARQEWQG